MESRTKSRWTIHDEDTIQNRSRKLAREEKKQSKAASLNKLKKDSVNFITSQYQQLTDSSKANSDLQSRPAKRRRVTPELETPSVEEQPLAKPLRFPALQWQTCRSVEQFEKLNDIAEGAYGWVTRARETATGEIVVLKRFKMDMTNDGVPVTGLREIQTLRGCDHPNILNLREVVVGEDTSKVEKSV